MSQDNVELARRAYDAFNRRDLDAFLALCHADVEFISYAMQLEGGDPYQGPECVRAQLPVLACDDVQQPLRVLARKLHPHVAVLVLARQLGVESERPDRPDQRTISTSISSEASGWPW